MSSVATCTGEIPKPLASDLIFSPPDGEGRVVVTNHARNAYIRVGKEEVFLLRQLDGERSVSQIAEAFRDQFREAASVEDIQAFAKTVERAGLLRPESTQAAEGESVGGQAPALGIPFWARVRRAISQQSLLYFRVPLVNPSRLLAWLEPRLGWIFSFEAALVVGILGVWAIAEMWLHRTALTLQIQSQFGWSAMVVAWVTVIGITILHEFGHGLACRRFGGDVREMGALGIFFTPCFYCNVSDAWLFPSRWRRLVVSLAGTYVDLISFILGVIVWRVTAPTTAASFMAWIIVSTCGARVCFNLNPLMRLDGYYALADLTGIANLRRKSRQRMMEYVRCLLWGAKWPDAIANNGMLIAYGVLSFIFAVGFFAVFSWQISTWLRSMMGWSAMLAAGAFFVTFTKRFFSGSLGGEFWAMVRSRPIRVLVLLAATAGILCIPVRDRSGGEFLIKPLVHWEVRAPIAGFLSEINTIETDQVAPGSVVARMAIPELTSLIIRKRAEIAESEANLKKLSLGPRQEIIEEQAARVERAMHWQALAQSDLEKAKASLNEELTTFDHRISQAKVELEYQRTILEQAQQLHDSGGLAGRQLLVQKKQSAEALSALNQVQSQKRARQANGVLTFESELARREKELADAKSELHLLEIGSRPEEIEAEEAKLRRLNEELTHLLKQEKLQEITCPVKGTVITPRLSDKIGQWFERGAVMFVVEDLSELEAEISIAEYDSIRLSPGQTVTLKPRLLPYSKLEGEIQRISPAVLTDPLKKTTAVTVYCRVKNEDGLLKTGMTGFGQVHNQRRYLGALLYSRFLRTLRTEFWL
jgi:putative peptide zinc metalloprotease protein